MLRPLHDVIPVPRAQTFTDQPTFEHVVPGSLYGRANREPTVLLPGIEHEDIKVILLDFQRNWEAAVFRQEEMMTQMLQTQMQIQRDVASIQSTDNKVSLHRAAKPSDICEDTTQRRTVAAVHSLRSDGPHAQEKTNKGPSTYLQDSKVAQISHQQSHAARTVLGLSKRRDILGFDVKGIANKGLRARLFRILSSKEFDVMLALAIMCNAWVICMESQYHGLDVGFKLGFPGRLTEAQNVWPGAETTFLIFDWLFGIFYLLEFIAKFTCWRCAYFYDCWNLLDCLLVVLFLVDKIVVAQTSFNPMILRAIRLFRLARLVRLIRFLDHLEPLYVMTTAIGGLAQTLGWAMLLLTVMLLTCDLFLVQLLQVTYFSHITAVEFTEDQLEKHHMMYEYFGTSTRCMLSMFEITMGDWQEIARLLSEEVSEWFIVFCLVHKLSLGFAVLGVINGVILQETFRVAEKDDVIMVRQKKKAENALRQKMSKLFHAMDLDGDGKVNQTEFLLICQDSDIKMWLHSLDIEADDLPALFQLCDKDRNGALSLEEVATRLPRIKGGARSIDMLSLLQNFKPGRASMV